MKLNFVKKNYLPIIMTVAMLISCAVQISRWTSQETALTLSDTAQTIVIDAGHGGEDGGASTMEGVPESQINLEIALRLNDLFHLFGYDTVMIRTSDVSIYSPGAETIAQKKVSDIKNRVALVENTENALLVSIHQNTFPDAKYSGAQVFSAPTSGSEHLAKLAQSIISDQVDPGNIRKSKTISQDVYLMNHITCTGILAECGFLSNANEAALLQTSTYQIKLSAALCSAVNRYIGELDHNEI